MSNTVKSLEEGFASLTFKADRTPESNDMADAFCELTPYRDGAVFLAHWAGKSPWEIHHNGDEIVFVIEGLTHLTLLIDQSEETHTLTAGQLMVVPQSVWHRLETPTEVKLMSVSPQPTEHSIETPA